MSKLRYVGTAWLPGVPARDLDEAEAKEYGEKELIASGLYEPMSGKSDKKKSPMTYDYAEGDAQVDAAPIEKEGE